MELFKKKEGDDVLASASLLAHKPLQKKPSSILRVRKGTANEEPIRSSGGDDRPEANTESPPVHGRGERTWSINNPMGDLGGKTDKVREKLKPVMNGVMASPAYKYLKEVISGWLDRMFPYLEGLAELWAMPATQATVKLVGNQLGSMAVGLMLVFFGANFAYLVSAYTAFMNVGYVPISSSYQILVDEYKTAHMLWAHTNDTEDDSMSKQQKAHQRRKRFLDSVKACNPKNYTRAIAGFFTGYVNVVASLTARYSKLLL
jgi:hypothetical protein